MEKEMKMVKTRLVGLIVFQTILLILDSFILVLFKNLKRSLVIIYISI